MVLIWVTACDQLTHLSKQTSITLQSKAKQLLSKANNRRSSARVQGHAMYLNWLWRWLKAQEENQITNVMTIINLALHASASIVAKWPWGQVCVLTQWSKNNLSLFWLFLPTDIIRNWNPASFNVLSHQRRTM